MTSAPAHAQSYPVKPIRLISGFTAGGGVDIMARLIGPKLTERLGQPMVIDNRGGAGGIIGMDAVAKSPPDGYTLLLAHSGITYMPGLYRTLPFDPEKDFEPVITAVTGLYVLAVSNDAPFKTIAEMVAYAKANPSKLSYGSAGIGSTLHLGTEFLKRAAGINIIHVPYKGAAQATTDLVGGQIQVMIGPAVAILPLLGVGGRQVFLSEIPGPMKDARLTPRITETAKVLWSVYAVLTALCAIASPPLPKILLLQPRQPARRSSIAGLPSLQCRAVARRAQHRARTSSESDRTPN